MSKTVIRRKTPNMPTLSEANERYIETYLAILRAGNIADIITNKYPIRWARGLARGTSYEKEFTMHFEAYAEHLDETDEEFKAVVDNAVERIVKNENWDVNVLPD